MQRCTHSPRNLIPLIFSEPPIIQCWVMHKTCRAGACLAAVLWAAPITCIEQKIGGFVEIRPFKIRAGAFQWARQLGPGGMKWHIVTSPRGPHLGFRRRRRTRSCPRSSWPSLYWAQWQSRAPRVYCSSGSRGVHRLRHLKSQPPCPVAAGHQTLELIRITDHSLKTFHFNMGCSLCVRVWTSWQGTSDKGLKENVFIHP